ncbi:MAG: YfhO family protein [Bacteroidia bacterium]|nr:YfhO family protein [Bacteroidia bacterium]
MKNINLSKMMPYLVAIVLFFILTYAYFPPLLEGKRLKSQDMLQYSGTSKEINDYRDRTGKEALWTNSLFGGMPAYLISTLYPSNLFSYFETLNMQMNKPANYLFMSMISFFILLLVFRVNPWLAIAGAVAYGFSTYFFIIESVGHHTKALAMAYMPGVIAGVYLAFKEKILLGAILFGVFFALMLTSNHFQIMYYTFLIILILAIFQFISDIREKKLMRYLKVIGLLVVTAILALLTHITSLWLVYDYSKDSTRGTSELTQDENIKTKGLDKDYATGWSYGKLETFDLFIPGFAGGSSEENIGENSETYRAFKERNIYNPERLVENVPLYWGPQPSTSGPVYLGAVIVFLFILGMFLVKGPLRWWLFTATVLSIMLAWGRNFMFFSDLFFDYFPGYDKFRTVSMILIMAEFTVPLLGILAVNRIVEQKVEKKEFYRALKWSLGILGGLALFFILFASGLFDFTGSEDKQLTDAGWPVDAIRLDRISYLKGDAIRSLVFVLLTAGLLWVFYVKKISKGLLFAGLALLVIVDLWPVNKRYLNDNYFVSQLEDKNPFKPSDADKMILQDKDPDYRVMNVAVSTFNDASTSYFHKSIGGYHGAKMKRYQELIEAQISKRNFAVLDMLNTKYFIFPDKQKNPVAQRNPGALGNAWFVKNFKVVDNADAELKELTGFNPKAEAVVDKRFENELKGLNLKYDSLGMISLVTYEPNDLIYKSKNSSEQLAVFSEIYYSKGWDAFIDSKPVPYFRVNYVLRALRVPAGEHKIEFRFEPKAYFIGEHISLASSALLIILFILVLVMEVRRK